MNIPRKDGAIDIVLADLVKIKKAIIENTFEELNIEETKATLQSAHSIISVQRRKISALER